MPNVIRRIFPRRLWGVLALGCCAVMVVDAGGALISRATGIEYTWFGIGSLVAYCAIGIAAAHVGSVASAAIASLLVAVFDSTVGWWVAWQIGPGRLDLPGGAASIVLLAMTGMFVVSLDTAIGTVAGAVWERRRARAAGGMMKP